jgi:hypothetical protein
MNKTMQKMMALGVIVAGSALLLTATPSKAQLSAAGKAATAEQLTQGLVEEVGRRHWRRHGYYGHRRWRYRNYGYRRYRPYYYPYYSSYYSPYYYPYRRRWWRPGVSIYFRF